MTALGIAAGVALLVAITLDLREQIEGAANTALSQCVKPAQRLRSKLTRIGRTKSAPSAVMCGSKRSRTICKVVLLS